MLDAATISAINKVVKAYFDKQAGSPPVPAKDFMPAFISAGIFPKDDKAGLPIRKILRKLDKENRLHSMPFVLPVRKQRNTNWFFAANKGHSITPKPTTTVVKKMVSQRKTSRQYSDEAYVIDLCDEILGQIALRQHTFDFLLGDKNSAGTQRKLPVDAYYPALNLVIEYWEIQHTKPVAHFDKPHIKTISGYHRGEQRKLYDQRKREILQKHGVRLIVISYDLFNSEIRGKIFRNPEADRKTIAKHLKKNK